MYSKKLLGGQMDFFEASAKLERIELLARIATIDCANLKDRTVALVWISEMAEEMQDVVRNEIKNPQSGGLSGGRGFQ
ncbi:hypothetical protein [Siccibacter colletis]|uniref:hypothetical protein n=1 Tax=Siccibacter colletis TaxID=1505757 RepID=UPI002E81DDB1|nr:hypothetical protein [Siccibacter colletis]